MELQKEIRMEIQKEIQIEIQMRKNAQEDKISKQSYKQQIQMET